MSAQTQDDGYRPYQPSRPVLDSLSPLSRTRHGDTRAAQRHRPDHLRGDPQRPRFPRRRDGADHHEDRLLRHREGRHGLLDRALRPGRTVGGPGPEHRAAPGLFSLRRQLGHYEIRGLHRAGGRLYPERPLRFGWHPSARHLHHPAGIRRRRAGGLLLHDSPPDRRRRDRPRQQLHQRDRDLPGGDSHTHPQAIRARRAQRHPVRDHRDQRQALRRRTRGHPGRDRRHGHRRARIPPACGPLRGPNAPPVHPRR